jgi:hypothetical protein
MVTAHETLFGKEYIKVLVANSDQEVALGYIGLDEFTKIICGEPTWVVIG